MYRWFENWKEVETIIILEMEVNASSYTSIILCSNTSDFLFFIRCFCYQCCFCYCSCYYHSWMYPYIVNKYTNNKGGEGGGYLQLLLTGLYFYQCLTFIKHGLALKEIFNFQITSVQTTSCGKIAFVHMLAGWLAD